MYTSPRPRCAQKSKAEAYQPQAKVYPSWDQGPPVTAPPFKAPPSKAPPVRAPPFTAPIVTAPVADLLAPLPTASVQHRWVNEIQTRPEHAIAAGFTIVIVAIDG